MPIKFVKPKDPEVKVPLPLPKRGFLPVEGRNVEFGLTHWQLRFRDGDITVEDAKPEAPAEDEAA